MLLLNIIITDDTVIIPDGFLPFGVSYGDSTVPEALDGTTDVIELGTDVVIFDSRQNRLYVSYMHICLNPSSIIF